MPATIAIRDETTSGQTTNEFVIDLLTERLTVRELIRSRIYQEVKDYNTRRPEYFRGLVQPTGAEQTLNGFKLAGKQQVDWKQQFAKAIEAFKTNRILVLVDNRQVESLDEQIVVGPETQVTFLRLTLLVGG